MMIFSGPLAPKFIADALVASENVGEGGPGETARLAGDIAIDRIGRGLGIAGVVNSCRGSGFATCGQTSSTQLLLSVYISM